MRTVGPHSQSVRLNVKRDINRLVRLQFMLFDKRQQKFLQRKFLQVQTESLAPLHTHGQNLLHQSAEPLQLLLTDTKIALALDCVIDLMKIKQGIGSCIGYGYRCFQFMGNVIGKVTLHFFQGFLPQNSMDKVPERETENQQNHE